MSIAHLDERLLELVPSKFIRVERFPLVSGKEGLLNLVSFFVADIQFGGLTISEAIPALFQIMFRLRGIIADKIEDL